MLNHMGTPWICTILFSLVPSKSGLPLRIIWAQIIFHPHVRSNQSQGSLPSVSSFLRVTHLHLPSSRCLSANVFIWGQTRKAFRCFCAKNNTSLRWIGKKRMRGEQKKGWGRIFLFFFPSLLGVRNVSHLSLRIGRMVGPSAIVFSSTT